MLQDILRLQAVDVKDTDDFTLPPGDRTKEASTMDGLSWVKLL